jgi:transposase
MSLKPQEAFSVPDETRRVAVAAFPKGCACQHIGDVLGCVYQDKQFEALFPRRGQPAEAPGRLALATVLQFTEGFSDRQTADAVRARIDWKRRFLRTDGPFESGARTVARIKVRKRRQFDGFLHDERRR